MNTFTDALRSIVICQSCMMMMQVTIGILLLIKVELPRPGRLVGLILTGVSISVLLGYTVAETLDDYGKMFDYQIVLSALAVYTGSCGFCLLIAHTVVHSDPVMRSISRWFKKE